jgi:putative phage-type endonuclease
MHVLVPTLGMEREEWLMARRKGIGGSDAAAIAGLNRWRSPIAVWLEKTGQIVPEEPGEAAYWGIMLEDLVAQEFTKRTGKKVRRRNAILQHPEHPFMLANVDRLVVGERAGLECKISSEYRKGEWGEDGETLPPEYLIQVQHYMAVTGYDSWYLAVLIGGNKFIHFRVDRDQELIDYLIKIESDFWKLVEDGTPPPMDGSDASKELLSRLYPKSNNEAIELPKSALELIEERDHWAEQEKLMAEKKQEAENKLKQLLGDNEVGWVGERKVTWKTVTSQRLDTKKLQAEHPDIYAKYVTESSYRRFSIK